MAGGISPGQASFAAGVLRGVGAPVTPQNIAGFVGWSKAEGGDNWQRNNPLNTTEAAGSSGQINSVGVRAYPNAAAGIAATVRTLRSGRYGGILGALRTNNVRALPGAIGNSPWGTSGSLAAQTIAQTLGQPIPPLSARGSSGAAPGALGAVTTQRFDQAGFDAANARFIAGSAVKQADSASNPFGAAPGASAGLAKGLDPDSGALFANGLLSTTAPNPQAYVTAHTSLQQLAGVPLSLHPVLRAGTVAGGFLPKGATFIRGRKDQGRDGQTNPGGPLIANGAGVVVAVKSDPNGFGPAYPVVAFKSGPDAGKTIYFGHTLAAVRPGQQVQAGQVISRTGRQPVGNASVPGWFEIGLAPGGVPGPFGQPTPF